ncbi:zinc finger protein ZPR1-like [Cucumis melo var. makuwa]|uniref:Zinc finger protein ZPR1-like n=1 Tax=Cucumis melo var. makuwa TaxID=1194695 RepID=A0A5A7TPA3_CUCMM|nr:zinc finger protein ZPR1-like [Cucumis melo var. makuwa]TYK29309.1 zinc finger protein ZPR1-like [Cucumis melo var. makuwa]
MAAKDAEEVLDVQSVVEAVVANEDAADVPSYEVESLCMRCGENGITRFLLTLIPHFRKILLSAFECPHCGERNNEVQFAGEIQPRGCCYCLEVHASDQKVKDFDLPVYHCVYNILTKVLVDCLKRLLLINESPRGKVLATEVLGKVILYPPFVLTYGGCSKLDCF